MMITDISDEIADRNRQSLAREFAFVLESVSSIRDIWDPITDMLPKISGFEAIAVYQRNISDNYVLFISKGGKFSPEIPNDSIVDRIVHKGESTIFDKHRMGLFPEGTLSIMDDVASLVLIPIVHEGRTVFCIVLSSVTPQPLDTVLRDVVMSTTLQISTVASRCFLQEKLQQERDRTRSYLDIAGVMLVAIRRDGVIEMINQYGAKLLGYAENDLIGRDWFQMVVPTTVREKQHREFKRMMSGRASVEDKIYHGPILCSDGTEKSIQWRNSLLREKCGSIAGVISSGEIILK
jgi:PAS domain S-box-containing protein